MEHTKFNQKVAKLDFTLMKCRCLIFQVKRLLSGVFNPLRTCRCWLNAVAKVDKDSSWKKAPAETNVSVFSFQDKAFLKEVQI